MRVPLQRLGSRRQKMSDAETLQAVETVLQALADDEWAGMAMRNENRVSHLVVAGDGAAAN